MSDNKRRPSNNTGANYGGTFRKSHEEMRPGGPFGRRKEALYDRQSFESEPRVLTLQPIVVKRPSGSKSLRSQAQSSATRQQEFCESIYMKQPYMDVGYAPSHQKSRRLSDEEYVTQQNPTLSQYVNPGESQQGGQFQQGQYAEGAPGGENHLPLNDEEINNRAKQTFPEGLKAYKFGKQPQKLDGRTECLEANMFAITLRRDLKVYHHPVQVKNHTRDGWKACTGTDVNRRVVRLACEQFRRQVGPRIGLYPGYDGASILYTRFEEFPDAEREIELTEQVNRHRHGRNETVQQVRRFKVSFPKPTPVVLGHLFKVFDKKESLPCQTALQMLDIILLTDPMGLTRIGRTLVDFTKTGPEFHANLSGWCEARMGYFTSVRIGSNKLLLNVDVSPRPMFKGVSLKTYLQDKLGWGARVPVITPEMHDEIKHLLVNMKVVHDHLNTKRTRRIMGLTDKGPYDMLFTLDNGQRISVANHFRNTYNIVNLDPNLPCVIIGRDNMFPIDVCHLPNRQSCNYSQLGRANTEQVVKFTPENASKRFELIRHAATQLTQATANYLNEFQLQISTEPVQVTGHLLNEPKILGGVVMTSPRQKAIRFQRAANFQNLAIATLGCTTYTENNLRRLHDLLIGQGGKNNLTIGQPRIFQINDNIDEATALARIKNEMPNVTMTVFVLGPNASYVNLKKEAETSDLCMSTQCVNEKNILETTNYRGETKSKLMPGFGDNLLMQMNAKLGGINWQLSPQSLPSKCQTSRVIFMGADVNHAAVYDNETPSIAAVVASLDSNASQFHAVTRPQTNGDQTNRMEYIRNLGDMAFECLGAYHQNTGTLPEYIFFYRDGVSEGQFDRVKKHELVELKRACFRIRPDYAPNITFIVVQKRHHIRFHNTTPQSDGGIRPGTYVDDQIHHPGFAYFFLCSHKPLRGTARPPLYHVLFDDAKFTREELANLSYNLCHMNARGISAMSIPVPVHYAHLAAFRAKDYLVANGLEVHSVEGRRRMATLNRLETRMPTFENNQVVNAAMKNSMYFL